MSKSIRILIAVTVVSAPFFAGSAAFAEESKPQDLSSYACKDVMRMSGVERDLSLAFVHGYRLGKINTTRYEVDALAAITDKFIDHCLDNPNDKALAAFEKIGN